MKAIPIYQRKQSYLTMFRTKTMLKSVNSLKTLPGIMEIRDVVDCLKGYYPNITSQIEGIFYPESAAELSRKPSTFFRPNSVLSEINWALSYMQGQWENLKWFARQKTEFEHSFLIGNYAYCHDTLSAIKDKLGVSLWYFESMCILLEYEGKRSDCMQLMSNTLESCKDNNNYIPSLIYNLHERTSRSLSPYKYDEDLNALYKRNKTDLHEDYYKYVLYRLNYFNQYKNIDLALPIMFESLSSLVDRYLILISVIKTELINDIDNSDILSRGLYLYNKTEDKTLYPILVLKGNKLPNDYYNQNFISVLDYYYAGKYEQCKEASKAMIAKDSSLFDAIVFYCRSLIYIGGSYENPIKNKESAPLNEICQKLYNVLTYKNVKDNLYNLYRINKNLYSFHIASGLDNFIHIESNEEVDYNVKFLNIFYFDPLFSRIWGNVGDALNYIDLFNNISVDSVSCQVWRKKIINELVNEANLPIHITGPINVDYYFRKEQYKEAFEHCEILYASANGCVPIRQTAVARMVECLYREGKTQQAINLYVKYYVEDQAAVAKVDTNTIIKQLQDNLYEDIRRNIELVIFVALTCKDTVDKSFILFEFCEIQSVKNPSELINKLDANIIDVGKLELFFSLMNDDETLRHYLNIDSYKERLTERKKILLYIISLNTAKKEVYQSLLKKVDDALLVYNLSRNMDESKIYANDEAIINYKLTEIDGLYSRYRLLVDTVISKRKDIFVVDFSGSSFFNNQCGYEKESNTTISINNNGLYEVFNNLYNEIREQFLNSDYGLVAYLSTRVRHGELETMLRPEMAQRHLILSMRDKVYQNDLYWTEAYNLRYTERTVINDALVLFSTTFDNAVTYLIKHKLQIFDKKMKSEGLFNFDVDEKELACKAIEIGLLLKADDDDRVTFCQHMLKWLWEKTEVSLSEIREYINGEFSSLIIKAIIELETSIKDELPEGYFKTDILAAIRSASEAISLKIKKISKWFNVSHPKLEDVDLKAVSHQIYNTVQLSHTNCTTDATLVIKGDSFKIRSIYVIHYADILRNIMSNMFDHSVDNKEGKRELNLSINIDDEYVNIRLVNDTDGNPNELNAKFSNKLKEVKSVFDEGGSGIAKVNKILKHDLNCPDNTISMHAEKGKCYTSVKIKLEKFKAQ